MNPYKRKFCYDFKAVILLAIPVLITLHKLSGHELIEEQYFEIFPGYLKILVMAAGTIVVILFFLMKYAKFNDMTAKITSRKEFPEVFTIIENLSKKLKMDVPEIGFLESSIPNAFVYKLNKKPVLILTVPLIEILDNKELETVLAHELTHIRNCDLEIRKFGLLIRFAFFLNPIVHLIEPFISRSREYLADEIAAWITSAPGKLASALLKVEDYTSSYHNTNMKFSTSTPPDVFFFECYSCSSYIFSRCPSTESRIKRLMSLNSNSKTSQQGFNFLKINTRGRIK